MILACANYYEGANDDGTITPWFWNELNGTIKKTTGTSRERKGNSGLSANPPIQ